MELDSPAELAASSKVESHDPLRELQQRIADDVQKAQRLGEIYSKNVAVHECLLFLQKALVCISDDGEDLWLDSLDLETSEGQLRTFALLHDARPALLNFAVPGRLDIARWGDRVRLVDAEYSGAWELPVIGKVPAPAAVLIRPDGYVAWVGDDDGPGLAEALTRWFGAP